MIAEQFEDVEDRDEVCFRRFNEVQGKYLKTLVNDDIIEEYRRQPLGQHSEPLERLLLFFRRLPMENKFAIKRDDDGATYRIVAFSAHRGELPKVLDEEEYATVEDAYFGIFMKYINGLMES